MLEPHVSLELGIQDDRLELGQNQRLSPFVGIRLKQYVVMMYIMTLIFIENLSFKSRTMCVVDGHAGIRSRPSADVVRPVYHHAYVQA